jgi:FtsP/CotA-like multicopper oxidase with cupredoxin domain
MWNEMRMSPTDLADLSAATLTYLMNGTTPAGNWTGLFRPGERVRLRFVNGAGNTFYDVRIPGLKMTVVQADGVDVEAVSVDEFRFGPGETYDVIVEPKDEAYTIFAQSMDRTGYARGTLAVREGVSAAVPELDPAEWLTMADMMGAMGGGMSAGSMDSMDHGAMAGMNHGAMTGMSQGAMAGMDHSAMAMDHSQHGMAMGGLVTASQIVRHARTEYGPSTDMRVDMPRTNLDDPGIGLRNNGRKVLTLADLSTIGGPMDPRGAEREIELHLTGNMERYAWSVDGLEFGRSTPVHFNYGERLRVILHNDTMMTHPMHLHGMWSELETARRAVPGPPAHDSGAARPAFELPGHRRRARSLGLALPPPVPHGRGHVPRGGGDMNASIRRENTMQQFSALALGLALSGAATAWAQSAPAVDEHAGHHGAPSAAPVASPAMPMSGMNHGNMATGAMPDGGEWYGRYGPRRHENARCLRFHRGTGDADVRNEPRSDEIWRQARCRRQHEEDDDTGCQ